MKNPRTQFLPNFSVIERQKSLKKKPGIRYLVALVSSVTLEINSDFKGWVANVETLGRLDKFHLIVVLTAVPRIPAFLPEIIRSQIQVSKIQVLVGGNHC